MRKRGDSNGPCFVLQVTDADISIINVDYNTKFDIKEAKRAQSGMYKIIATNEHGKDEADVEIVILGQFIQKWKMANFMLLCYILI